MKFKTTLSIQITDKKKYMENKSLFYADVFYLFTAAKYKYEIRTSANVDLKQNSVLKIIHLKELT